MQIQKNYNLGINFKKDFYKEILRNFEIRSSTSYFGFL
jgi:hypothetical protein